MPYFTYRVTELDDDRKNLEYIEKFDKYREARSFIREKREADTVATANDYRMIFAKNKTEAEALLSAPRDKRVIGED